MVHVQDARRLALSLPEATEQDHHGIPSFRVRDKIFATLPDRDHLHVFVDEDETRGAVAETPAAVEELWWGKQLRGVRVSLPHITPHLLAELVTDSWRRRAPRRLVHQLDASTAAPGSSRRS